MNSLNEFRKRLTAYAKLCRSGKVLCIALVVSGCISRNGATTDHEEQYLRALREFVHGPLPLDSLSEYAKRNPDSIYADDACALILWTKSQVQQDPLAWESFLNRYPDGRIEPLTFQVLGDAMFPDELTLGYERYLLLEYMGYFLWKAYRVEEDVYMNCAACFASELLARLEDDRNGRTRPYVKECLVVLREFHRMRGESEVVAELEERIEALDEASAGNIPREDER